MGVCFPKGFLYIIIALTYFSLFYATDRWPTMPQSPLELPILDHAAGLQDYNGRPRLNWARTVVAIFLVTEVLLGGPFYKALTAHSGSLLSRKLGRQQSPTKEDDHTPVKPPVEPGRRVTGMSFLTTDRKYAERFMPFLRSKACWFQRHGFPYIIQIVPHAKHPTYLKIEAVQKTLRLTPEWLFFLDADTAVMRPEVPPSSWVNQSYDIIVNDHNAALNNGAFILRTTEGSAAPTMVATWEAATKERSEWPFTDNGSFLEALFRLEGRSPSICAHAAGKNFYPCVNREVQARTGLAFDGRRGRVMHKKVFFSPAVPGFNNHAWRPQEHPSWGWTREATFFDGESAILHTKNFPGSAKGLNCSAGDALAVDMFSEGVVIIVPGIDKPCRLEDNACATAAKPFLAGIEVKPEESDSANGSR